MVLSQLFAENGKWHWKWHLVAFLSKSLSETEQNYEIHDKKMLAIIWALEEWWHFLEGAPHKVEITRTLNTSCQLRSSTASKLVGHSLWPSSTLWCTTDLENPWVIRMLSTAKRIMVAVRMTTGTLPCSHPTSSLRGTRTGRPREGAAQTHPGENMRRRARRCSEQGSKSLEIHFRKIHSLFQMVGSWRSTLLWGKIYVCSLSR